MAEYFLDVQEHATFEDRRDTENTFSKRSVKSLTKLLLQMQGFRLRLTSSLLIDILRLTSCLLIDILRLTSCLLIDILRLTSCLLIDILRLPVDNDLGKREIFLLMFVYLWQAQQSRA